MGSVAHMPSRSPSGGVTALGPAPHPPSRLSREPSKEDLEMAQSLRNFKQSGDRRASNQDVRPGGSESSQEGRDGGAVRNDGATEVAEYHSLQDTRPLQRISSNERSPPPSHTAAAIRTRPPQSNPAITGQVCRYVLLRTVLF